MWLSAREFPAWSIELPASRQLATVSIAIGIIAAALGVMTFRRFHTTVNPTKPENASALIVTGIFRYTRNPMYVGVAFVLLGWALLLGNALAFLGVPGFVAYLTRFQIIPEERALAARYGSAFAAYRSRVRRWL